MSNHVSAASARNVLENEIRICASIHHSPIDLHQIENMQNSEIIFRTESIVERKIQEKVLTVTDNESPGPESDDLVRPKW